MSEQTFDEQAKKAFPSPVILISGDQIGAGDDNAESRRLPPSTGHGNLTQALLAALRESPSLSWQKCMEKCKAEHPKLSSTRSFKLTQECRLSNEGGGSKRAFLVGISYNDPNSYAHKNVYAMKDYLLTQGFKEENINILMDNEKEMNPTKIGIFREFNRLVRKCTPADDDKGHILDSAFVYFCGHGSCVGDDETHSLYPMDYHQTGVIKEEDIFKKLLFVMPCPLFMVIDLVNSGVGIDLPYSFSPSVNSASSKSTIDMEQTAAYAIGNVVTAAVLLGVAGAAVAVTESGGCDACCMGCEGDVDDGGGCDIPTDCCTIS